MLGSLYTVWYHMMRMVNHTCYYQFLNITFNINAVKLQLENSPTQTTRLFSRTFATKKRAESMQLSHYYELPHTLHQKINHYHHSKMKLSFMLKMAWELEPFTETLKAARPWLDFFLQNWHRQFIIKKCNVWFIMLCIIWRKGQLCNFHDWWVRYC